MITLSDTRMLDLWRSGAGLEPALADASVERFDALNVDDVLRSAMREWYLDLLHHGPLDMVPVTDIAERATVNADGADNVWQIRLTPDVTRVVGLSVTGYGPVRLVTLGSDEADRLAEALDNPFVRRSTSPRAMYNPGERKITVWSTTKPQIDSLRAVVVCEDDTYILDERALGLIPEAARSAISNI